MQHLDIQSHWCRQTRRWDGEVASDDRKVSTSFQEVNKVRTIARAEEDVEE